MTPYSRSSCVPQRTARTEETSASPVSQFLERHADRVSSDNRPALYNGLSILRGHAPSRGLLPLDHPGDPVTPDSGHFCRPCIHQHWRGAQDTMPCPAHLPHCPDIQQWQRTDSVKCPSQGARGKSRERNTVCHRVLRSGTRAVVSPAQSPLQPLGPALMLQSKWQLSQRKCTAWSP